ncbi:MAG TPA: ArsA family ATPase [Actinomycetes bacterium]
MRILLFTGKGGVGKTTVAAATAARAASLGHRTLVMSTDPAHSLGDSFDVELGAEPREVAENLWAEQIDSQARLEANWRDIQDYVVNLLNWGGVSPIEAEELSVIPGLDELFSLIDINRYHQKGGYDLLVVDCAPTAETLRLLSLPDALGWYIDRIFPSSRRMAAVARPLLGRIGNLPPIASDAVFAAVERLYRNLERVRVLLAEPESSSVRLVVNPEKMVVAEARRTYTYLSLFGYRVDAVVVNRLLPDDVTDPYFGKWKEIQADHFRTITESFAPLPILTCRLFDDEMVGLARLGEVAVEVYGERDPADLLATTTPIRVSKEQGGYALRLDLPFAERAELDVMRKGDELLVKVGQYKRNVLLPQALRALEVVAANLRGGTLVVRFAAPDGAPGAGAREPEAVRRAGTRPRRA